MKRLEREDRAEVLPALAPQARSVSAAGPAAGRATLRFETRVTRTRQFPVEQSLARMPEGSSLGRFLDVEV